MPAKWLVIVGSAMATQESSGSRGAVLDAGRRRNEFFSKGTLLLEFNFVYRASALEARGSVYCRSR